MKKLPDEYIVKCDQDAKKCKKVYSNFYNDNFSPSPWKYIVCSPKINIAQFTGTGAVSASWVIEDYIRDEFAHLPVLTYKEWKKLKQMKKEIIGYRLVKPEYEKAAVMVIAPKTAYPNATTFKELNAAFDIGDMSFQCNSYCEELLRAAGVLDLWFEPVYKGKEKEFEFGRWYKDGKNRLVFIESDNTAYGFNMYGEWFNKTNVSGYSDGSDWQPATDTEVKERLLAYAREKYPEGTRYKSAYTHTYTEEVSEQKFKVQDCLQRVYGEEGKGCLLYFGKWAEIISEPEKDIQTKIDELIKTASVAELVNFGAKLIKEFGSR